MRKLLMKMFSPVACIASIRSAFHFISTRIQLDPLPIRHQFRGYSLTSLKADCLAGMNVALLAFPQGMAYAMLAKLPIQYGIYASAIASVVAPLFSRCSLMVIGPTNATAVMLLSVFLTLPPEIDRLTATAVIVFLMSVFLIFGAFLQVASLLKFISRSVIIGYITGAALLIMANQLHHAFGTKIADASTMVDLFMATARSIPDLNWVACLLAAITIAAIYAIRRTPYRLPDAAIALLFASLVGVALAAMGMHSPMVDAMPAADWKFTPPVFTSQWLFLLTGPALAISFLAAMESTVMAKTLSSKTGERTNSNQEMLSLGLANLGSGLFSGMPASGSLTRSALNGQSGGVTGLSSIFAGLFCAGAAMVLGPFTAYIPKAVLAALVITVALSLIDFRRIKVALRATKSDAAVLLVTFLAAMFTPLDFAIFLGVGVSIALFLHKVSTPRLVEYAFNAEGNLGERENKRDHPHIAIIHVEGELFFGASDLFREELRRVAAEPELRVLILRMRNAHHLDATSILALEELILSMQKDGGHLIMSGASRDVYKIMRNTGVLETLGRDNFFMASPSNPNLATRNALKRAQELLGDQKVEIRIYHDPAKATAEK
jgi:sulfate permease, SulP family